MQKIVKGLFLNQRENRPDFVVGTLTFKTGEFIQNINEITNAKGYANVDILKRDDGSLYLKPNTYGLNEMPGEKPNQAPNQSQEAPSEQDLDVQGIPF